MFIYTNETFVIDLIQSVILYVVCPNISCGPQQSNVFTSQQSYAFLFGVL